MVEAPQFVGLDFVWRVFVCLLCWLSGVLVRLGPCGGPEGWLFCRGDH